MGRIEDKMYKIINSDKKLKTKLKELLEYVKLVNRYNSYNGDIATKIYMNYLMQYIDKDIMMVEDL